MHDEELPVRIVRLEPLRVACLNGYGASPERTAFELLRAYVREKGLDRDGKPHRYFGYNNPNPSPGSPNYGYDVWVTVDESIQSEGDVRVFDFPGGLYAVMRIHPKDGDDIHRSWMKLVAWRERSPYRMGSHQWLEEHFGDLEQGFPDLVLDLYMPIAE
ncbi:DNA gyrase inhibitor [Anaerolinea thermolimosa]|nr:GyrI-like domain-containing protein [Anaerolinea thermolimosa]GAP08344.1 DNA gyrase inhibitor [Anaerolinea thermolimosa]